MGWMNPSRAFRLIIYQSSLKYNIDPRSLGKSRFRVSLLFPHEGLLIKVCWF